MKDVRARIHSMTMTRFGGPVEDVAR